MGPREQVANMWVRAHLRVPAVFGAALRQPQREGDHQRALDDVAERLQYLGLQPAAGSIIQDPTDPTLITALGYATEPLQKTDGVLDVTSLEPIQSPPDHDPPSTDQDLDDGLTQNEALSVRWALENEVNPRHLTGFASTLEPWFPASASALRVRAALLEPGASFRGVKDKAIPDRSIDMLREDLAEEALGCGMPLGLAETGAKHEACRLVQDPRRPNPSSTAMLRAASIVTRAVAVRTEKGPLEVLRIVDARRLRKLIPPGPRDGFVSGSALKLALATTGKPELSGVAYRALAPKRTTGIEGTQAASMTPDELVDAHAPGRQRDYELLAAKDALNRAERCLERCRWTRWYSKMSSITAASGSGATAVPVAFTNPVAYGNGGRPGSAPAIGYPQNTKG
jgi:hypothetical protein